MERVSLNGPQDTEDRLRITLKCGGLSHELATASRRQPIVPRLAIVLGYTPLGGDPRALFHTVERGVERAFLDVQLVLRGVADPFRNGVAVHRPPREGLQDEEVERPLQQFEVGGHAGAGESVSPLNV